MTWISGPISIAVDVGIVHPLAAPPVEPERKVPCVRNGVGMQNEEP